jgi:CheY-like chemotaxis protein
MSTETLLTNFYFQSNELPCKLQKFSEDLQSGYWKLCLRPEDTILYLAISQGQVVFAGTQHLTWNTLLNCLCRYIPQLRTTAAREAIAVLEDNASVTDHATLDNMLRNLESTLGITHLSIFDAVQTQILTICDRIWEGRGEASFTHASDLCMQAPISGITMESLVVQTQARQQAWSSLKTIIPSMEAVPTLNSDAFKTSILSPTQKQHIEKLISLRKSLDTIAQITAKDPLTTAKTFAHLVQTGLVSLQLPATFNQEPSPEIFIVDDSSVFLQQFQTLVSSWGYKVNACSTTDTAIETMLAVQPDLIFLDINMPGLSGFDLIKAVRREVKLKDKKLVLLTAENSQSNQWRAKWGNCKFLAKPRTLEEIQSFQVDLRQLLQEEVPVVTGSSQTQQRSI